MDSRALRSDLPSSQNLSQDVPSINGKLAHTHIHGNSIIRGGAILYVIYLVLPLTKPDVPNRPIQALKHQAQQLARVVGGASHPRSDMAATSSGKVVLQRVHGAPLPTPEQDEISKMAKEEVHQATRYCMCTVCCQYCTSVHVLIRSSCKYGVCTASRCSCSTPTSTPCFQKAFPTLQMLSKLPVWL